jgi:hypothetical protein
MAGPVAGVCFGTVRTSVRHVGDLDGGSQEARIASERSKRPFLASKSKATNEVADW